MRDVIKGTDRKNIKCCLDVGHANAIKSKYSVFEWIEALADERENPASRFHGIIKSVSLLGYEKALKWEQTSQSLRIFLSEVETNLPLVFKVELV